MHETEAGILVSPTDLTSHHACPHVTHLDLGALASGMRRPSDEDPMLELLARRGDAHERAHLERLRAAGLTVAEIPRPPYEPGPLRDAEAMTLEAMRSGADVIYQATFCHDGRAGFADFLRRVERPSDLGTWSYEVHDTKLTVHVKVSAILQVCEYSVHLERLQGVLPQEIVLVLGDRTEVRLRVADHIAYYRAARRRFDEDLNGSRITHAEPCAHCPACTWTQLCSVQWRREDSLVLVARITSGQRVKLSAAGVTTMQQLSQREDAVPAMAARTFERLRGQARLQVAERDTGEPVVELLDAGDRHGLASLPPPSPADIFFDIEGDPLWPDGGLEYLLGAVGLGEGEPPFLALWAHDRASERTSFEMFIDLVTERHRADPAMHVYHYAAYEVAAMKRLAARHATRELEVDELLRGGVFVDLLTVVRRGVRASKENYSLKSIEKFFMPHRDGDVKDAGTSVVEYERWMAAPDQAILDSIEAYNRFDCIATERLRAWLEELRVRAELEWGRTLPRPEDPDGSPPESVRNEQEINAPLITGLISDETADARIPRHLQARALLAHLLGFHRREERSLWWDFFAHHEFVDEDFVDDTDSIGHVAHDGWVRTEKRSAVHRFTFDRAQEHRVRVGHTVIDPTGEVFKNTVGDVMEIGDGWVDIKMRSKREPEGVRALFPWGMISAAPLVAALRDVAGSVIENGIDGGGPFRAARDLLLRRTPRLAGRAAGEPLVCNGETPTEAAVRITPLLEQTTLAIQGPPGAGKTYTAARMAVEAVHGGRVIGIASSSHRAAGKLLEEVVHACAAEGVSVRCVQKSSDGDAVVDDGCVEQAGSNKDVAAAIDRGARVVVGSAWLFASAELRERIDLLFIDEAGQMSLANAVAAATSAHNVVLLGDPQQLPQVLTGLHPDGADASALGHFIGEHATVAEEMGLFLDVTWRMHPEVCAFVSDSFYEGRLRAQERCSAQAVNGGSGLRFVPVPHAGRAGCAPEEVTVVADIAGRLLDGGILTDADGIAHPMTPPDILVVTPFNAQVEALQAALPQGVLAGTVDKFQGREAAVVVYSMACSTVDDAPRGVEFLYDLHRFNVAISRAKALAYVIASPELLDARCRMPNQVPPVNALCRFAEIAEWVGGASLAGPQPGAQGTVRSTFASR